MLKRSDIIFSLIIGFVFGWLLMPVAANLGVELGSFAFFMPIVFAIFAAFALFIAWLLSKFLTGLFQFAKFASVGALNFSIDFGVLNILILLTGITAGLGFIIFKSVSVAAAIVNSYLWNKFWTFQERETQSAAKEFLGFLVVTLVGIGVNVGTAHLVVNVVGARFGAAPAAWANIGAAASVVITLFWNFFGYKFFVFKKAASTFGKNQPPAV